MSEVVGSTTASFRSELFRHGEPLSLELGHIIFKQGSLGKSFFYIVDGLVEIQFDGRTRRILRPGDFFGEIRILGDLPRTATARCLTACQLIELPADQIHHLVLENPAVRKKLLSKYGSRLMHFKMRSRDEALSLQDADFEKILSPFEHVIIPEHEYLFSQGGPSDALYLILRGCVHIIRDGAVIAKRKPGDIVGEIGVLHQIPRTASVFSAGVVELLQCDSSQIEPLLSRFPQVARYLRELAKQRLRKIKTAFK